MSAKNQISVEIPQAVIAEVNQKLQDCRALLAPYLQGLTPQDRETLFKMGDKTVATVQKVKSYMDTNPEFIPSYMDKVEFLKDEAAVTSLNPLGNLATQLATDIGDTVMLAGPIYEDLSQRFARKGYRKTPKAE